MAPQRPIILSTWSFGRAANAAAWPILAGGGSALDAVQRACIAVEDDPTIDSVGRGGLPDASGRVSLDGCVMLSPRHCAGVCFVRRFNHPVSIARCVMEQTHHVLLAGEGADAFAAARGFTPEDLLTDEAREVWRKWRDDPALLKGERYRGWLPPRNVEELRGIDPLVGCSGSNDDEQQRIAADESMPHNRSHDTIGVLAIDAAGAMAGACSTSGMAFKVPGRVGDSPIIGHGLYVDPAAGAAVATGTGELLMRTCGCFLAVELMRQGACPADAARAVVARIVETCDIVDDHQVGLITLKPDGTWASAALRSGFRVASRATDREELAPAGHVMLGGDEASEPLL